MQSVHIVSDYDEELKYLSKRIAAMGGHAERMVEQAVAALVNADPGLAQKVINDYVDSGNKSRVGSAATTIEPGTGKIIAMVQSSRFKLPATTSKKKTKRT